MLGRRHGAFLSRGRAEEARTTGRADGQLAHIGLKGVDVKGQACKQKGLLWQAARYGFLWLAAIAPLLLPARPAAAAQETASPIPTTEIATRAAEVATLLANVDAVAAPSPERLEIERRLPERTKRIQTGWEALG